MARIARVVASGFPHHVTQRGNRRQPTFFCDEDYRAYKRLMAEWCDRCGVEVWGYCLMPNHVHLIVVPATEDGLRRAIGEAHRRYTRMVNFREGWRGHLWQGRFSSFVMDECYLLTAVRYVELNPLRAGLSNTPEAYAWSSAAAHTTGAEDELVKIPPVLKMIKDWRAFLSDAIEEQDTELLRRHERTGRPLGVEDFVTKLEKSLGRTLRPRKPGRRKNDK